MDKFRILVIGLVVIKRVGWAENFNTDQSRQFTSENFISVLKTRQFRISMDGKGRGFGVTA